MFQKLMSWLVITSILTSSVAFAAGGSYRTNARPPDSPIEVEKPLWKKVFTYEYQDQMLRAGANKISEKIEPLCQLALLKTKDLSPMKKKLIRALGWVFPPHLFPLAEVFRDPSKTYVILQTLKTGIPIQLSAYVIAHLFKGNYHGILADLTSFDTVWKSLISIYLSYNYANTARSGVETDKTKSMATKIWQSSLLAIGIYSWMDTLPKIAGAVFGHEHLNTTQVESALMLNLTWTAFSVFVRVYGTTPLFNQVFPQKGKAGAEGFLEKIEKSTDLPTELAKIDDEMKILNSEITLAEPIRRNEIKNRLLELRSARVWFKWARKGLDYETAVPKQRITKLQKIRDFTQYTVAIAMLTGYMTLKPWLQGDEKSPGVYWDQITNLKKSINTNSVLNKASELMATPDSLQLAAVDQAIESMNNPEDPTFKALEDKIVDSGYLDIAAKQELEQHE